MAMSKKMAVFLVVVPCRLVYWHCSHRPEDGGNTDLRKIGKIIPVYTALQPKTQP
jgi:hypothetical protein